MVNTNDKLKMAVNVQKIKDSIFLSQGIYYTFNCCLYAISLILLKGECFVE